MNVSVDSVQLTQATRPKRRIYVENLPSSAFEAAVMQWLTGYLRLFGLTHVQNTSPCISCIVNKEKGQALVEFLTPEDASNALNLDGKSLSLVTLLKSETLTSYRRNLWLQLFQLKPLLKTRPTRCLKWDFEGYYTKRVSAYSTAMIPGFSSSGSSSESDGDIITRLVRWHMLYTVVSYF
ncbi:putative RNA recognition motif domain, nucleotide-binding alpha-beta plait domain superfamily [Helianthus anomalus]